MVTVIISHEKHRSQNIYPAKRKGNVAKKYINNVIDANKIPQIEAVPGKKQVKNNAGGFVFEVTPWVRLERWCILGSESGSFYCSERDLTKQNIDGLRAALAEDGKKFVDTVVGISHSGRAPKNDPALFALAMAAADVRKDVAAYALANLSKVARIPTHLFSFIEYSENLRKLYGNQVRGYRRSFRGAIADWYLSKDAKQLAYQVSKYQSRDGWSNRDIMRLAHPKTTNQDQQAILHWVVKGELDVKSDATLPIWAFEETKKATKADDVVKLITDYNLPRECVPTQFLNNKDVWAALLEKMPMTAMIRNLGKMTDVGLITPNSDSSRMIGERLENQEYLQKARIHPISVLMANSVYSSGHGMRGSLSWTPVDRVVNALEKAFYLSFANAPKTGKRFYLGLDVSGSMGMGHIAGAPLTPREAAAAMSMVTMRTEPDYYVAAFQNKLVKLDIGPDMTLPTIVNKTSRLSFGSTDCAQPMIDALAKKIPADIFIVYTDNETWSGEKHPFLALREYRQKMGIDAKLIVVGMTATQFSIADPSDAGMTDVVGFDASVPQIIAQFAGAQAPGESEEV